MRISCEESSPFFSTLAIKTLVTLDGVEIAVAIEADDVEGWVECIATNDVGSTRVRPETYRLTGVVKLRVLTDAECDERYARIKESEACV